MVSGRSATPAFQWASWTSNPSLLTQGVTTWTRTRSVSNTPQQAWQETETPLARTRVLWFLDAPFFPELDLGLLSRAQGPGQHAASTRSAHGQRTVSTAENPPHPPTLHSTRSPEQGGGGRGGVWIRVLGQPCSRGLLVPTTFTTQPRTRPGPRHQATCTQPPTTAPPHAAQGNLHLLCVCVISLSCPVLPHSTTTPTHTHTHAHTFPLHTTWQGAGGRGASCTPHLKFSAVIGQMSGRSVISIRPACTSAPCSSSNQAGG